jgi:hypothetical protein
VTISARAIAVQGFGYVPRFVALQGLVAYQAPSPQAPAGARRMPVPPGVSERLRQQLIDEDELMLLMAAQIAAAGLLN